MTERISCVELITQPRSYDRNGSFATEAYVKHDFWKSTLRLRVTDDYFAIISSGVKHILVFDQDLDGSNIPYFPEAPQHDWSSHLVTALECFGRPD